MKGPAQAQLNDEPGRLPPFSVVTARTLLQPCSALGSHERGRHCSLGLSEQSHQQPNQEAGTFSFHMYVSYGCRLVAKEVVSLATGKQGLLKQAGETGSALRQEGGGGAGRREGGGEK